MDFQPSRPTASHKIAQLSKAELFHAQQAYEQRQILERDMQKALADPGMAEFLEEQAIASFVREEKAAIRNGKFLMAAINFSVLLIVVNPDLNGWLEGMVWSGFEIPSVPTEVLEQAPSEPEIPNQPQVQALVFPLKGLSPKQARITDLPGSPRSNGRIHAGVDYAYVGPIVAALGGRVSEIKPNSGVGGIIGITSSYKGQRILIRYVHLDREPLKKFNVGDRISPGQYLSSVSQTFPGSSGPHPHIEVYRNGRLDDRPHHFLAQAQ